MMICVSTLAVKLTAKVENAALDGEPNMIAIRSTGCKYDVIYNIGNALYMFIRDRGEVLSIPTLDLMISLSRYIYVMNAFLCVAWCRTERVGRR